MVMVRDVTALPPTPLVLLSGSLRLPTEKEEQQINFSDDEDEEDDVDELDDVDEELVPEGDGLDDERYLEEMIPNGSVSLHGGHMLFDGWLRMRTSRRQVIASCLCVTLVSLPSI